MQVYEYDGAIFDDEGIRYLIQMRWKEMIARTYDGCGSAVRNFMDNLPDHITDEIKEWLLEDMSEHINYDMLGIKIRTVQGREDAFSFAERRL